MAQESITKQQEEHLKNFLLDIDCLDSITKLSGFNPFDVLKIARTEIRHSNMLAWLFDPNGSHRIGPRITFALIAFLIRCGSVDNDMAFQLLRARNDDVIVKREWNSIDILLESQEGKYVICFENKVDTQDHSDQLNRYYRIITDHYTDFMKIFLYLTPDGLTPNNDDYGVWQTITYADIINIIEQEQKKVTVADDVRMFLNQYLEVLRRETMEDSSLSELCRDIYAKHKDALDLIFEYRPDALSNVREYCLDWFKKQEEITLNNEKSAKSLYHFQTKTMDRNIPKFGKMSVWNTEYHYNYELEAVMDGDDLKCRFKFVVNSNHLSWDEKLQLSQLCRNICDKNKHKKTWNENTWGYITPISSEWNITTADNRAAENFKETFENNLDAMWKDIKEKTEKYFLQAKS